MNLYKRILHTPFFIRLLHWEYWSFNAVYLPVILYWFYLCARVRSLFFFSAANPTIENGGFIMESKWKIYQLMPQEFYPKTDFLPVNSSIAERLEVVRKGGFQFPFIIKPDIGGKGRGVKKIHDEQELLDYLQQSKLDCIVQEFADHKNEFGIFYCRYPGEENGFITGIVGKELLSVTGDGISTMDQLIRKEKRFILQLDVLEATYGDQLNMVLPLGEEKILVPYGNHARGAKFTDETHLVDEQLTKTIDAICKQIDGFYYGRLDIRFSSLEELKQGKNYAIIEANGAGSEPTHMYDPRHSIFFAWKEIIRHWKILWRISRMNHKRGIPYMGFNDGKKMFRDDKAYQQLIAKHG